MPISLTRYVDITSGVGAATNVGTRQLGGQFFDDNALIPSGGQITFSGGTGAALTAEVLAYFGAGTEEYLRAVQYFGWVSKNITSPQVLSFARWNSVACAPVIFGAKGPQTLAEWTSITAGAFTLQMGATTQALTNLNFSGAGSLSAVATILQSAIQAISGGGALWTGATVVWDSTTQQFNLLGGLTGTATISVTAGTPPNDIAAQLGWLDAFPTTILGNGAAAETPVQALTTAAANNNNFGSFGFMNGAGLSLSQVTSIAQWNNGENVTFMYVLPVTAANASSWFTALGLIGGTAPTLDPQLTGQFPEMMPMMILAATDYTDPNSTVNYMYQQFDTVGIQAAVTSDLGANTYDPLSINYYGNTQTAGQIINFYQRGVMWGSDTSPLDQNTYANEIWLKDALGAALMTLLLALGKVSANIAGQAQIINIMQGVINQALYNGTISVGKILTVIDQLYITQITNDPNAWKQVQNIGYWLGVVFVPTVVNGQNEYIAQYTLIYSKDDVIRTINGSDILI